MSKIYKLYYVAQSADGSFLAIDPVAGVSSKTKEANEAWLAPTREAAKLTADSFFREEKYSILPMRIEYCFFGGAATG